MSDIITFISTSPEIASLIGTVLVYVFSFITYMGYLSCFSNNSIGPTPFPFSDMTLVDILSIFPVTIYTLFIGSFKKIWEFVSELFFYFVLPFSISIIGVSIVSPYAVLLEWSANILFLSGVIIWMAIYPLFQNNNATGVARFGYFCLHLLSSTIASFLISWSWLSVSHSSFQANTGDTVIIAISTILFYLLGIPALTILLPYLIGRAVGEKVVKNTHLLSRVRTLVVCQPVEPLKEFLLSETSGNKDDDGLLKLFFPQKDEKPSVYSYKISGPLLYMVASFKNISLFYLIDKDDPELVNGNLIVLSNQFIVSIEMGKLKLKPSLK